MSREKERFRMNKPKIYLLLILVLNSPAWASQKVAGKVESGRSTLTWASQVNREYTVLFSTNLTEGFSEFSTVQSTPPLNTWWEDLNLDSRFYTIGHPVITNTPGHFTSSITNRQVINGDFSSGLDDWQTGTASSGDASFLVTEDKLFVDIVNGSTKPWHISLRQKDLIFTNGNTYTCKFNAQATSERTIQIILQGENGSGDNLIRITKNISTNMASYVFSYTMTGTNQLVRLQFGFGNNIHNIWVDDIEITDISSAENTFAGTRNVAHELNRRMGKGNNFMASKSMGFYGASEDYSLLNTHHFAHCRIGYKMDEICGGAPNYLIPENHMDNLQNMVDWCLAEGLIPNIDPVHNWANGPGLTVPDDLPKLSNIWVQVATHFADYSLEDVPFELVNEPHTGAKQIIQTGLAAIRGVAGNETRVVIVAGDGFSTRQALIDALNNDEIPANDNYLIGTFHYYDPRDFTKQGAETNTVYWGSESQMAQMGFDFDAVLFANTNWAVRNGTSPLPLYLGEFGVDNGAPEPDRKKWLSWIRMQAEARDISWAHWNMYINTVKSKGMGPWSNYLKNNPQLRSFDPDPVEALIGRYEVEDGSVSGGVTTQSDNAGFTGTGYAAFPASVGDAVWARVDGIYIPRSGIYTAQIHYASETNSSLRLVSYNDIGTTIQTLENQLFPSSGSSNSWKTIAIPINFEAGDLASLKIVAAPDQGIQLDWLKITQ